MDASPIYLGKEFRCARLPGLREGELKYLKQPFVPILLVTVTVVTQMPFVQLVPCDEMMIDFAFARGQLQNFGMGHAKN